jgi:hypothetical protein
MGDPVVYRFLGPISRGRGYCTVDCVYDANGVCLNCECLDPERFVVFEFPTKQEDAARQAVERLQAAGIEVRRV